jgi:Flp pilus assembly protein TadB
MVDVLQLRTWVFFYLICFVAMLWATFLLVKGAMLWVSILLVIVVLGFNFILLLGEIRRNRDRKDLMKQFSHEGMGEDPAGKEAEQH